MLEWDASLDHEIIIDGASPIVYGSGVGTYLFAEIYLLSWPVEFYQLDWTRWTTNHPGRLFLPVPIS